MGPLASLTLESALLGYILAFGTAAVICFAAVARAARVDHDDTRRGLVWLLLLSGGWATAHVTFLLAPTPELKLIAYYGGLIVGFAAVGPWLYFCSAYTGRSVHRSGSVRILALTVFIVVLAVKFTNPFHGYYFQATLVDSPFTHLSVVNGPAHWVAMGVSYALASIGYFLLLELFWQVGHDTRPLAVLIGLSGLPVVLDILGASSPLLLDITYEPLGVAAMAIGLLYVYFDDLQTVRLAGERNDPVIVLDDDGHVRDFNREAETLFPALSVNERLDGIVPEIAAEVDGMTDAVIEIERAGGTRYYQLSSNQFSTAQAGNAQLIALTDITEREQYRSRLERQNERLDRFASVVSHDLRNPMTVAKGRIELAREARDDEDLAAASDALDRMSALIDDLLTLAREGRPISETEPVALSTLVEDSRSVVATGTATIGLEADLVLGADPDRTQQLLENLFRNAVEHGSPNPASRTRRNAIDSGSAGSSAASETAGDRNGVTILVGVLEEGDGFYVADDGPGIPADKRDEVFAFGVTTQADGTGFGLAIVAEIVEAHGWTIDVTESDTGGARFEVSGVAVRPDRDPAEATTGSE
jgi:signal transduction histidine kinase